MQIIGVREITGEYEGKPYHKVAFHCATEFEDENSNGYETEIVKVKYDDLVKSFNKNLTNTEIKNLVNNYVEFHYDKFGNANFVKIITNKEEIKK